MTIGIIGGGIAGLAAAIALARQGREITVYEQAAHFEEVGAGLQTGPNAISALKQLGAFDAIADNAFSPPGIRIMDALNARQLTYLPLGERFEKWFGQPYRVIHRADLLAGLLETARTHANIDLKNNMCLKNLAIDVPETVAQFKNNHTARHKLLVGADGFRSTVRRHLFNDGPALFFGHTLHRALVDLDSTIGLENPHDVHLWLYPGGHVVHYPVSGGKKLNIVAATESDWQHRTWNCPATPAEVLSRFPHAAEPLEAILQTPEKWLKWAAAGHPSSPCWHRLNTVLIGDAIHASLPYLAQGAAMAIEDAVCLAHAVKTNTSLKQFADQRRPRTDKLVATAARHGKIYHLKGAARQARNLVIRASTTRQQYEGLSWIYRWSAPSI